MQIFANTFKSPTASFKCKLAHVFHAYYL